MKLDVSYDFGADSFGMAHVSFSRGPESVVLTENRLTKVKTRLTPYLKLQLDSESFLGLRYSGIGCARKMAMWPPLTFVEKQETILGKFRLFGKFGTFECFESIPEFLKFR